MRSRRIEREELMDAAEKAGEHEVSRLRETVNEAEDKLRNLYNTTTDEIANTVDKVESRIRHTPIQSSLIALAAGFVVGLMFRR